MAQPRTETMLKPMTSKRVIYPFFFCAAAALLFLCPGCSGLSTRNVASYIFDGVPAPPEPEIYCSAWLKARQASYSSGKKGGASAPQGSLHRPYKEKRCNDCHDKSKENGLVAPNDQLCFRCHKEILKGMHVHAPAGAGDCLACHLPHDSTLPYLLAKDKDKLCIHCHQEARQAQAMHGKFVEMKLPCYDCHNPHAGSTRYFYK